MNTPPILSDEDLSFPPSERTLRGRTTPRGERLRAGDVLWRASIPAAIRV